MSSIGCKEIVFSDHPIGQMFQRNISVNDIKSILFNGEVIREYLNDKPFPSFLLLGFINKRPLHVVVGKDEITDKCIIITSYEPLLNIWESDFKTKKK